MSAKGKLAICGFSKTLHTEWSKADLFSLNIATAFTDTSNMPRRGILLKLSSMMSRKSLFCNTNLRACLALVYKPHICTTGECFEVGEILLVPHQNFGYLFPFLVTWVIFFSKLRLETYYAESLEKCSSQGISYFIRKNTDFDRQNNIDESV